MNARYCAYCGAPLHANARFCSQCGKGVEAPPSAPPGPPPQAYAPPPAYAQPVAAPSEPILHIIPGLQQRKGLLGMGREMHNLILTPARLIFVPVSAQEMRDAVSAARAQAKGEGRGWLGQVAAQMAWVDVVAQSYRSMPLDAVLAQHAGSFYILLAQVTRIRFRETIANENQQAERQMIVESAGGKHTFDLVRMSTGEVRQALKQLLPHVVR